MSALEENARAEAIGRYCDWLALRYQRLDVTELASKAETNDPIALRQIYVPVRIAEEDLADEDAFKGADGKLLPLKEEGLPGEAALDVLAREPFVALSGRPGSGKTTLVQAIVAALVDREPGELRRALPAIPVPFLLRRLNEALPGVRNLADLFSAWWPETLEQAAKEGLSLDRDRLDPILRRQEGLGQILLLFDGIDEVDGTETRQRVLDIALAASRMGFRVLVTGRPAGYASLRMTADEEEDAMGSPLAARPVPLHHLQPFAWPQIAHFITRWYALRDEWQRDAERGIQRFLDHLAEPARRRLLDLARRPIFLTLMALVNCTENAMPEGRARLYEKIVDLYLGRQERFRQRKALTDGTAIPPWDAGETRRVLARLAMHGQTKAAARAGEEDEDDEHDEEADRRFLWLREVLVGETRRILAEGRFETMTEADAEALVKYFLNPSGLLVDPEEGKVQFAHLSFQEYLCAVDFHERSKVADDGASAFAERELFPLLDKPGWDEVGLLFLCVHSDASSREGHLNVMARLDPADRAQAALFVSALTGRELSFTEAERRQCLPGGIACALLQPRLELGGALGRQAGWDDAGVAWLLRLLACDDEDLWATLEPDAATRLPKAAAARTRWLEPVDDQGWDVDFGPEEARAQALLQLVADCGWGQRDDALEPIASDELKTALARWVDRSATRAIAPRWTDDSEAGSALVVTNAALELNRLVSATGPLFRAATERLDVASIWLEGDAVGHFWSDISSPATLLALAPRQVSPAATLGSGLFQVAVVAEALPSSGHFAKTSLSRSRSLSLSLSRSRSLSLSLSRSRSLSLSFSRSLSLSVSLSPGTRNRLEAWLGKLEDLQESAIEQPLDALMALGFRQGGFEWFDQQASDPELARCRGIQNYEPLPRELDLFDATGRLKTTQRRSSLVALRRWIDQPETVFDWLLRGQEIDPELRARKLAEMRRLWEQPWGPLAYVQAVLDDWPADVEEVDISVEKAERDLLAALEEAGF